MQNGQLNETGVNALLAAASLLRERIKKLRFRPPVSLVYNPLEYAWAPYASYLRRYGGGNKRVVFLGMNPGPFGMVQTGVPFGEVAAVRNWLRISGTVHLPGEIHPCRPIHGFECPRSEVSGRRLWGLFAARFGPAASFFRDHFVLNYCPLAFLEKSGRNRTPDRLPPSERRALFRVCDHFLATAVNILQPQWVIGVGDFALGRAEAVLGRGPCKLGRILHPSPASPAANKDWAGAATRQLLELGVWTMAAGALTERPSQEARCF